MQSRGLLFVAVVSILLSLAGSCKKDRKKVYPPQITSLNPDIGLEEDVVIIHGAQFSGRLIDNKVTFSGVEATVLLSSPVKLTVIVPLTAFTGPVKVTVGALASNEVPFTVLTPPTLTNLVPDLGPEGTLLTIQGRYFGLLPQDNNILLGGFWTPTLTASPTELTCFVPEGAPSGDVTVEVVPEVSNPKPFTVTTPRLYDVQEFFGSEGTSVVLTGEKFSPVPGENIIRFTGIESPTLFASSYGDSLSTLVPAGTRSGEVTVEVAGGRGITNGLPFCLDDPPPPAPTVSTFGPSSGDVGNGVQIVGANFSTNASDNVVRFNGTLSPVNSSTGTVLNTEVPPGAVSGPITVEVAGQGVTTSLPFTVNTPAPPPPGLISILPSMATEGTTVLIRGTDFSPGPSNNIVSFAGVRARVIGASPVALMVEVPYTSGGPVTVDVGGQVTAGGLPFTYTGSPAQGTTISYFNQVIPTPSDSAIFVIDISGTMDWLWGSTYTDRFGVSVSNGTRLDLAKDRTAAAIDSLPTGTGFLFNVVAFDCGPIFWETSMQAADATTKAQAIAFVTNTLLPSGSSDTGVSLAAALAADTANRTVALVSDGSPTCGPTSEAAHLCEILTANTQGAAIHTIGIQPFGDFRIFMQELADLTGGAFSVAN